MSRYTFTAFGSRKLTAKKKQEETCTYNGNYEEHDLFDTTRAVGEWDKYKGVPQFWSGGEYAEAHCKEDWQGSAQVTLEYDRECLPYLEAALDRLPWQYHLASTMGDRGAGVLVQIPLAVRVTNADTYTRIAGLLASDIDLIGARKGSDTITYLWQWDIADLWFKERAEEGVLMEPMTYHARNKGRMVYFADHVDLGRANSPHTIKPASPEADGLFQWGGE